MHFTQLYYSQKAHLDNSLFHTSYTVTHEQLKLENTFKEKLSL